MDYEQENEITKITASTLIDLNRYVNECAVDLQNSEYDENVIENVTNDFRDLIMEKYNFKYGDEIPVVSDEEFWDLFKPYEL